MNQFRFTITALAVLVFTLACGSIAQAQATRTWVSGVGDDANPCSRTAPCKTWAGAISKTAINGEIDALDPGGFGTVTITKSITIDGGGFVASDLNALVNGIVINITNGADTQKAVTIRGLTVQGAGTGLRGVNILAATSVFIENSLIEGQNGSPGNGIDDSRSTGGLLEINNTTIINCAGNGISVNPSSGNAQINVHIANSRVQRCLGSGLFSGSNVHATIFNSSFTQNVGAAVFAQQTAGGTTDVAVDQCVVSANLTGFQASTSNAIIRVSNTTAVHNVNLALTAGGGQVSSYGNNQTGGLAFPSTPTGPT